MSKTNGFVWGAGAWKTAAVGADNSDYGSGSGDGSGDGSGYGDGYGYGSG